MVKTDLSLQQLQNKAEDYCSRSEHCAADVQEKLFQWGCRNASWKETIINHLLDDDFINEARYCNAFAHDKLAYQGWGRVKIQMALKARHLSDAHIQSAIDNLDAETYETMLKKAIATKKKTETNEELIIRFCMQRGFTYAEITKFL